MCQAALGRQHVTYVRMLHWEAGGAIRFLLRWGTASEEDKDRWREIIHTDSEEVRVHTHARAAQTQT